MSVKSEERQSRGHHERRQLWLLRSLGVEAARQRDEGGGGAVLLFLVTLIQFTPRTHHCTQAPFLLVRAAGVVAVVFQQESSSQAI